MSQSKLIRIIESFEKAAALSASNAIAVSSTAEFSNFQSSAISLWPSGPNDGPGIGRVRLRFTRV